MTVIKNPLKNDHGQALLELLLTSSTVVALITGSAWLLKLSYDRHRCAKLVFEKTREKLNTLQDKDNIQGIDIPIELQPAVQTKETIWGIEANLRCETNADFLINLKLFRPHLTESVAFRKLGVKSNEAL